jgi:hypothetical protein
MPVSKLLSCRIFHLHDVLIFAVLIPDPNKLSASAPNTSSYMVNERFSDSLWSKFKKGAADWAEYVRLRDKWAGIENQNT